MIFLYSHWRGLPLSTRNVIANAFGIAKVGPTHVANNVIESDGYKIDDVERALNVDKLQEYTGSDSTDMAVLFELTVAKAEGRETPAPVNESLVVVMAEVREEVVTESKKKGRKPKTK